MPADKQAVEHAFLDLNIFDADQCVHEVFGVYVAGLDLHFGPEGVVGGLEGFFHDLAERLYQVYFVLVHVVPAVLSVCHFEDLPILRLFACVALDRRHQLVDQEGQFQIWQLFHIVGQHVQTLGQILHRSPHKFGYLLKTKLPAGRLLLLLPPSFNGILYQLLRRYSLPIFYGEHPPDQILDTCADWYI